MQNAAYDYDYWYTQMPRVVKKETPKAQKVQRIKSKKAQSAKIQQLKEEKKQQRRKNIKFVLICLLILSLPTLVVLRSSYADELYTTINKQKAQITELEKENSQIDLNMQNKFSLTKIEDIAKNKLGMQKIDNSKIQNLKIQSQDTIEKPGVGYIKDKEDSLFTKVYKKIMNFI